MNLTYWGPSKIARVPSQEVSPSSRLRIISDSSSDSSTTNQPCARHDRQWNFLRNPFLHNMFADGSYSCEVSIRGIPAVSRKNITGFILQASRLVFQRCGHRLLLLTRKYHPRTRAKQFALRSKTFIQRGLHGGLLRVSTTSPHIKRRMHYEGHVCTQ